MALIDHANTYSALRARQDHLAAMQLERLAEEKRRLQFKRRRIFRTAQRSIVVNKRPYVRKIFLSGRWP